MSELKKTKTEKLCDALVKYEDDLDDAVSGLNGIIAQIFVIKQKIDAVVDGLMEDV